MNNKNDHYPVMVEETIKNFLIKEEGIYIDCTFGLGGHSETLISKLNSGTLIGFEIDTNTFSLVKVFLKLLIL